MHVTAREIEFPVPSIIRVSAKGLPPTFTCTNQYQNAFDQNFDALTLIIRDNLAARGNPIACY